jgi:hypothetical protein
MDNHHSIFDSVNPRCPDRGEHSVFRAIENDGIGPDFLKKLDAPQKRSKTTQVAPIIFPKIDSTVPSNLVKNTQAVALMQGEMELISLFTK